MHSAGGLVSPETARTFPIRLLESGPAGGGLATTLFGKLAGHKNVISFDMGGTTAKACMIEDGAIGIAPMLEAGRVNRFAKGSGLPIKAPVIDMIETGAGGGSIAAIDEVGLLKVGPHSASSDPGPACYGLGGTRPTVTDANLVLGYYDPGFFLGGRMSLDVDAARRAVASVASPLGLSTEEAAWGIHKVVVESMGAAARVHLVEKGKDPRHYAMVGFGGAGPAHAVDVARVLGVKQVIIPPAQRIEADPVSLEIMWSRLVNVVEEMWLTVCRTAFSLVISEAQDFACELLDPEGETLAHSPRAMPVFNLTLPRAVRALLERYPADTLKPGDVLVTNDPWLCAGHLSDIAVVTPVFLGNRMVGLMGTVGHVSDIGGTKDSLRAREIYEEGFQIPPMKLYEAGQLNETLTRLLGENVRNAGQVLGDLHSFVAANRIGAERLLVFLQDYGMEDLRALASVVQDRSEKAMRDAISALADGTCHGSVSNNPLGTRMTYPLALTVRGDTIHLDFTGAPPQLPQGGLNCTLSYTMAHATYPLKCMLTPSVRGNADCYRAFSVYAPEGSILNCDKPLAVNLRTRTGWYIAPNIFRALSAAAPRQVQAFTGLPVAASVYGRDVHGNTYSDMLFVGGGQGGSAHGDGKSGLLYPTSAANTSIETFEARVPVLVTEKSYITDSGGAGQYRGGLGQRVRLRKIADDGLATFISLYPEGVDNPIQGLFGGHAGGGASGRVLDTSGRTLRDVGTGDLVQVTQAGEIVELVLAGGAGYGPLSGRNPDAIARDIALELVSPEAANRDYGVENPSSPQPSPEKMGTSS